MPIPNTMADLATLASSNYPTGTESIGNGLDDYLRAHGAIIRSTNAVSSTTIASASTTNIGGADGESVQITGSSTINSFGTGFAGCMRELLFIANATIVNSANIVLPNAANIVTGAGEIHLYRCLSAGVWRLVASSNPEIGSVKGLTAALAGKLPNTGDNTYTGTLTLRQNTTLPAFIGGEVVGTTLLQNNGAGGDSEEFRHSVYRRVVGGDYASAVVRLKRLVSGFSQAYHDYHSGQTENSRAHSWGYASTDLMWMDTSGNVTANGNLTANSDERLKTNWRDLPDDVVDRLAGVVSGVYDRIDIKQTQVGVGAGSLREVLPWAVGEDAGIMHVAYGNAALVGVIALCKRLVAAEKKIEQLRGINGNS